jgi:hypothetical protein
VSCACCATSRRGRRRALPSRHWTS